MRMGQTRKGTKQNVAATGLFLGRAGRVQERLGFLVGNAERQGVNLAQIG